MRVSVLGEFLPVSSSPAKISEGRPFSAALSRVTCSGAIILHKCFSSLLGKLPPRLYHNILLLWCNFHRQAGEKRTRKSGPNVSVIRCSYGLLEVEIGFYLPSKSGNTIKLSSLTLNAILL